MTSPLRNDEISKWTVAGMQNMHEHIIINLWHPKDYT